MPNRAAELSAIIEENTAKVNAYLASHNLENLSFDSDVPPHISSDEAYALPRDAAIQACSELQALLGGATRSVFTTNATDLINLQAICRFNIAASFPKDQSTATYDELSVLTGVPEPDIRRIIRGALTNHVFQEKEPGKVSHTSASRFLAGNKLARQWVEMYAEEILPAAARMVDAMEKWPGSGEPNNVGYSISHNTDKICFDHMAEFPGRLERFGNAMTLFSLGPGYGPEVLIEYFSSNDLGNGVLVDVGGSHGSSTIPLLQKFPYLHGIVQDRPDVVEKAREHAPQDVQVQGRLEFIAHDFFQEQRVKGDVYLLRWILHDWSDTYCLRILRALIPALRPGTRILVHEWIVPEPHDPSPHLQQSIRIFDLYMRAICNGKEREVQDWIGLFATADPRFKVRAVTQIPRSKLGIIDVEWIE